MKASPPGLPVPGSDFWRPHRPWVAERWAVLVSEVIHEAELLTRLSVAPYVDEKFGCSENQPEPDPELFDLNTLD